MPSTAIECTCPNNLLVESRTLVALEICRTWVTGAVLVRRNSAILAPSAATNTSILTQ